MQPEPRDHLCKAPQVTVSLEGAQRGQDGEGRGRQGPELVALCQEMRTVCSPRPAQWEGIGAQHRERGQGARGLFGALT